MVNVNDPKLWKNIDWDESEVPELLKKSDTLIEQQQRGKRLKDIRGESWRQNSAKGNKERSQDPEWQKSNDAAMKKLAQDPEWLETIRKIRIDQANDPDSNFSKAVAERTASEDWQNKNAIKNRLLSSKQCVTPYGIFWSRADAAKYIFENNFLPTRKTESSVMALLVSKFKNNTKEYYYISKEEYIMLTGKEI